MYNRLPPSEKYVEDNLQKYWAQDFTLFLGQLRQQNMLPEIEKGNVKYRTRFL